MLGRLCALAAVLLLAPGCAPTDQMKADDDVRHGTVLTDVLLDGAAELPENPLDVADLALQPDLVEDLSPVEQTDAPECPLTLSFDAVNIDGQGVSATMAPGEEFSLSFTWHVSNPTGPARKDWQIVIHFGTSDGAICFMTGVAPACPDALSSPFLGTMKAPVEPGTHELHASLQVVNACLLDGLPLSSVAMDVVLGTIVVEETANEPPAVSEVSLAPALPGTLDVAFTLTDPEGDPASVALAWKKGDGPFTPATLGAGAIVEGLASGGDGHLVRWLAQVDLGKGETGDVTLRITPADAFGVGPPEAHGPFAFDAGPFVLVDETEGRLPALTGDSRQVDAGDVDGDLDVDLVLAVAYGTNLLLRNDGSGHFAAEDLPGGQYATGSVALLDLDGDQDLDLFVANSNEPSRVLLNDGEGAFTDATEELLGNFVYQVERALPGDVDGDLDMDLVLLCSGSQRERLLRNDGTGKLVDETEESLPADTLMAASGSLGTIDGEGPPDLVFNNFISSQTMRLWVNHDGIFVDESERIKSPYEGMGFDALFVDLNGDGFDDLFEANMMNVQRVLLNDGNGEFAELPGAVPVSLGPGANGVIMAVDAEAGDVDLDGVQDIVVGCSGQSVGFNRNILLLGSGSGGLVDVPGPFPEDGGDTRHVRLFDGDGDGDLDLFVVNSAAQSRLYVNQ